MIAMSWLLRSEMTALDFGQICKVVKTSLRPLEELFAPDPMAVGTASIAQVQETAAGRQTCSAECSDQASTRPWQTMLLHGVFHFLRRYFRPLPGHR